MSADSVDSLSSSVIEAVKSERADIRLNLLGSHLESNPELRRRLETNFQKVCMADMIASRMPDGAENLVGMLRSHDVLYLPAESGKVSTPSAPEASDLAVWALSEGCQVFAIGGAERLGDAAALVRSDARGDARSIAAKLREMLMLAKLGALPTDSGVRGLVEWRAEAIPSGRALLGDRSASRRVSWMESACREAESLLRRSDRERLATRRLAILGTNGEAAVTSDGPSPLARKRDLILERVFDSARTPYVDSSQQAPFDPTSESFHMNRSIRVRLRGMWIRSKGGIKRIPILGPVARRIYRVVKRLTRPAPAFDQAAALRELQGEIGTIRGDLVALYRLIESGIKARESDHEPVSEWTESHHRDHLDNVRDRLEHLASQVRDNSDTTRYLVEKYMLLAREAREHRADRAERAAVPEPRIIDRAGYEQRLERTGGLIRLNLGCGDRILPDYVNVDRRHLPGSQIIADVRALPFSPESVDEIASSHLIEHFRELQFRTYILPYWKSLLVAGGRLRIVCPNWAAMLSRVADGRVSLEDFRSVTFGFQDFEGDDHFAMYTPQTLTQLLIEEGFERVEVVVEERTNGLCQEMELIAYRNRDDGGGARSVQPPTIASAA
jgi:hypothetical protein